MRHRVAVLLLWLALAGCAAARAPLPESGATPTAKAPPARRVRTDGRSDGPAPRWIDVTVSTPGGAQTWGGWYRVGVWTPLDNRVGVPYVTRETWSKLGTRAPRRIAQVRDVVWNGTLARLRPTASGGIDFVVEVLEGRVEGKSDALAWEGIEVELPRPLQRSYRFEGRVPAGHSGAIAAWGELKIALVDSLEPSGIAVPTRFNHGFVAGGPLARAEYEERSWQATGPRPADYDGVLQATFRLRMTRAAAGFRDGAVFGEGIQLRD